MWCYRHGYNDACLTFVFFKVVNRTFKKRLVMFKLANRLIAIMTQNTANFPCIMAMVDR